MTTRHLLHNVPLALCLLLAACGGGGMDAPAEALQAPQAAASVDAAAVAQAFPAATAPTAAGRPLAAPRQLVFSAPTAAALNLDPNALYNYAAPAVPAYYDATVLPDDNTPAGNQINNAMATLGRVLFYDKQLSFNGTIACASCHQQNQGFGDTPRFSTGFTGGQTTAHAMRLGNLRAYAPGSMFWDKRAASVEAQATQPIQNAVEMGFDA